MARDIKEGIVRDGRVVRGWLGLELYDLSPEIRQALHVTGNGGAIIKGVVMNGPADDAGLQAYDVITHINDEAVLSASHCLGLITHIRPGGQARLSIIRRGHALNVNSLVIQRPQQSFTTG